MPPCVLSSNSSRFCRLSPLLVLFLCLLLVLLLHLSFQSWCLSCLIDPTKQKQTKKKKKAGTMARTLALTVLGWKGSLHTEVTFPPSVGTPSAPFWGCSFTQLTPRTVLTAFLPRRSLLQSIASNLQGPQTPSLPHSGRHSRLSTSSQHTVSRTGQNLPYQRRQVSVDVHVNTVPTGAAGV